MLYQHSDSFTEQARRYILNFVLLAHPDWLRIEGIDADFRELPQKYHQDIVSHLLKVHQIDVSLLSKTTLGEWDISQPTDAALALNLLKLLNMPLAQFDRVVLLLSLCLMGGKFAREILKSRLVRIHDQVAAAAGLASSEVPALLLGLKSHAIVGFELKPSADYLDVVDELLVFAGRRFLLQLAAPCKEVWQLLQTKWPMDESRLEFDHALLPKHFDLAFLIAIVSAP